MANDPKKPGSAPWDKAGSVRKPTPSNPGIRPENSSPESTMFVGGPKKPSNDESSILLVDSHKPYVAVTGGPKKGGQFTIHSDRLIFGRESPADILVDDKACSRRHAQVYRKGPKWYLKDLGSTNGTYLDGPLRNSERILWDGDVFKIGDWEFTFSDPNPDSRKK